MVRHVIVLDTHALVWWTQSPELLGTAAADAIAQADRIFVPSICFWETSLLVRKGRLALKRGQPVEEWASELLEIPRVVPVALSPMLALAADSLQMHADPADRFIVASALEKHAPLVTKDDLLRGLSWLKTVWE
jgi:PIN domain nuclease of toxin-antitoxin system